MHFIGEMCWLIREMWWLIGDRWWLIKKMCSLGKCSSLERYGSLGRCGDSLERCGGSLGRCGGSLGRCDGSLVVHQTTEYWWNGPGFESGISGSGKLWEERQGHCVVYYKSQCREGNIHLRPTKDFLHPFLITYSLVKVGLIDTKKVKAGNSLIGFPSEWLVFCPKMSKWAIR